jgi:hypothetical protein
MIFNPWRKFPRWKPKEDGYYLCTIYDLETDYSYVAKLYYTVRSGLWENNERINVFMGYTIYKVCRAPIEENRVYRDSLCNRTEDVVAWKKMPKGKKLSKQYLNKWKEQI